MSIVESSDQEKTVLAVDDNLYTLRIVQQALEQSDFKVLTATSGEEALKLISRLGLPHLAVVDLHMPPGMSGFEFCRSVHQYSDMPIIMLTARVDADSRLTGLRRGADAYLEKPFLQEELETRIQALLVQRQRLQAYYLSKAGLAEEAYRDSLPSQEEAELENDFLAGVNAIMEKHIDDQQFTVEQLSRELFMDSSNLYRKLKALTGINPNQYIRSFRLAKAKKLLANTNLPVISIAAECGFADQNYFSRIFKKKTGYSPSEYRLNAS